MRIELLTYHHCRLNTHVNNKGMTEDANYRFSQDEESNNKVSIAGPYD